MWSNEVQGAHRACHRCFIARITSSGIEFEFNAFGKSMYKHTINTNGNITLKVKKNKLPKLLRKLLKSDILIKISGVDLSKKRICVQIEANFKWPGWKVEWPKRNPRCFTL